MWVSRHPLNNSLVVFIHGIWGSRWTTWKSYVDFFQRMPTEKPLLRNYDVYLFNYESKRFRQPPLRPTVVRDLRMFLSEQNDRYDTIVLVCHSQGGLVGKLYLLEELVSGRGQELKVDMVLTLSTPHRGANRRNPVVGLGLLLGWIFKKLWGLRKTFILRQLADMSPGSENIRFLAGNWDKHVSASPQQAPAKFKRYIYSVTIGGLKDRLVSKESAEGFYVDHPDSNFTGHSADSKAVAEIVGWYLSQHAKPIAVTREIENVYSSPALLSSHTARCMQEASRILGLCFRRCFLPDYVDRRASCFIDDFFDAFMQRPLRKLGLLEAFQSYVERTMRD